MKDHDLCDIFVSRFIDFRYEIDTSRTVRGRSLERELSQGQKTDMARGAVKMWIHNTLGPAISAQLDEAPLCMELHHGKLEKRYQAFKEVKDEAQQLASLADKICEKRLSAPRRKL